MSGDRGSAGWRTLAGYGAMLAATVAGYLLIVSRGRRLSADPPAPGAPAFGAATTQEQLDTLLHVLLALVVVIVAARVIGALFRRMQQPPVVGEILAGILLGPSLLGRIAPKAAAYLLPHSVAPFLNVLAQVGVILYMFLVGLELDPGLLRKRGQATVAISHASIILPFVLGAVLALFLYPRLSSSDVPFVCFSLFLGVSMSVTAFPVLARILTDRRIHTTRMGAIAITCAAVDDVTAWCLLAFVVSVVQSRAAGAVLTFGMAIGYIALMVVVVRPLMVRLARFYGNRGRLTQGLMAVVFVLLLLSAFATDLIGIHAVFGAFALGAVIPHDSGLARDLTDRLEDLVVVLLLPAFFAFTGLRTQIGLVSGSANWVLCGLIVLTASVGKFGGSLVAARLTGLGWRDASALGILMNTRGLMELIVLNIGLELHVISPTLFAMLVLMALVTTFATTPIFHLITRGQALADEPQPEATAAAAARASRAQAGGAPRGILLPISNPDGVATLLDLALAATRAEEPPPRVLALVRRPPGGGVRSGLREIESRISPRAPILASAIEHARERGAAITPRAIWTDDPAADILSGAADPEIGWLLLGFHRPVFGADFMGGVVREVLEKAVALPVHVGVVIHGHDRPLERVFAVVAHTPDGRAALELAARIAHKKECSLHAILVPEEGVEPEPELVELLKDAGRTAGRWLHTDVLAQRNPAQLAYKTPGQLVVIGTDLADELGLPLDEAADGERCVVVVQGARLAAKATEQRPAAESEQTASQPA
jgi:Kef-type K+ transport system membrane component KefB